MQPQGLVGARDYEIYAMELFIVNYTIIVPFLLSDPWWRIGLRTLHLQAVWSFAAMATSVEFLNPFPLSSIPSIINCNVSEPYYSLISLCCVTGSF